MWKASNVVGEFSRHCAYRSNDVGSKESNMNEFHKAVAQYRECSRHVRNVYFQVSDGTAIDWNRIEGWREVDELLFNWLVLYPHQLQPAEINQPHPHIYLKLRGQRSSLLINRDKNTTHGYWDHPTEMVYAGDCDYRFSSFFDFDVMSQVDFKYVMVELFNAKDEDLNARFALIEWQHVEFEARANSGTTGV